MAKNDNLTDFLKGLADKFRSVLGTADPLNPQDFEDKIQAVRDEAYSQGFAEGGPTGITATAPDVLYGKVFGSGGNAKATGTMPDRGQYQYGTFGSGTGYVAINALPEGYYRSDGQSWAPEARISNSDMASGIGLTAAKLLKGQTVLGITGTGFTQPFYVGYNLYPTYGTFHAGKAPYTGTLRFYWGGCGGGSRKTNIDVHCGSNNGINRETFHSEFSGRVDLKVTAGVDVTFTVGEKNPYLVIAYYIS